MAFNLGIEKGIEALAIILTLAMVAVSINFAYTEDLMNAIYYMIGAVITIQFYTIYKLTSAIRLNHARTNVLTSELEEAGVINTETQEEPEDGSEYLKNVINKIDEVTGQSETKDAEELREEVQQEDGKDEEDKK